MKSLKNLQPPKLNLQPPKLKLPLPSKDSETGSRFSNPDETHSVSTEGLIAARPQLVNELLLKLVAVNSGQHKGKHRCPDDSSNNFVVI